MTKSAGQFEAETSLRAEPAAVAEARALLDRTLAEAGIEGARRFEALLVTSELVTNAISHGSRPDDRIGIEFKVIGVRLSIRIRDCARGRTMPVALTPDQQRPAGRGLGIVERLAEWSERVVDGQREVLAELDL
jgi:anti-sigma regulatory factor (Ser/Thr protein kinase)